MVGLSSWVESRSPSQNYTTSRVPDPTSLSLAWWPNKFMQFMSITNYFQQKKPLKPAGLWRQHVRKTKEYIPLGTKNEINTVSQSTGHRSFLTEVSLSKASSSSSAVTLWKNKERHHEICTRCKNNMNERSGYERSRVLSFLFGLGSDKCHFSIFM